MPLGTLLHAYERQARLTPVGRLAARADVKGLLMNRLRLQRDLERYPGITDEVVAPPLVITGLPRTGTTLLHALLAEDPRHRAPLTWEVMFPSPPPGSGAAPSPRRRIARAARRLAWMERLSPGFQAIHEIGAELPQECIAITAHTFVSLRFLVTHDLPAYAAFLEHADHREAYAFHHRFLQHLQWQAPPRRWVLKAPGHLSYLDALLAVYRHAMIVQTHRDPLEAIPSLVSLRASLRRAFSHRADMQRIGSEVVTYWRQAMDNAAAVRSLHDTGQFFDVDYQTLLDQPVDAIDRLYRHFGLSLSAEAEARMRAYLAANPQHKHGLHCYDACDSGMDAERLAPLRQRYRAAMGIEA